jgi:hypothetical protein
MPRLTTVLAIASLTAAAVAQTTTRDSLSSAGVQDPNFGSGNPVPSQDGRFLAFTSASPNLVPGDTNNTNDVFVRDRVTGQTTRVSVSSAGAQSNGNSLDPDISADGRFVVFTSAASNLVAGDTNNTPDIFCHDRQTATTTRVSVGTGGVQVAAGANTGSISADGRYVAFASNDNLIVPGDNCVQADVFCHDRQTGVTSLVSLSNTTGQTFTPRGNPEISDDGNHIAFDSAALDLVATDTNGWNDVFVWSRLTNSVSLVSVAGSGTQGNQQSLEASISTDGRFVVFTSYASNFVPGDNSSSDIFMKDRQTGQLTWCSPGLGGAIGNQFSQTPSISGDGRFVTFFSASTNLVTGDTNGVWDVFAYDLALATMVRASVTTSGAQASSQSSGGRISADGRCVAFHSSASNLVVPDANGSTQDVYVRDRGTTASVAFYGAGCPGTGLQVPSITNVGWPLVGNAAFGVGVGNSPPSTIAVLIWSTTQADVPFSGCNILVGSVNTQPAIVLDPTGAGVSPFAIPNDPTLANLDVFFQYLVIDVNGPFLALGTLSNGLAARIGN